MALTTEVLIFKASDAFRNDPKTLHPAYEIVFKNADGVHAPGYYGKQTEDPSTGYIFLNWDSFEAHKAVIDGPLYSTIVGALKPSLGGGTGMYHVRFSGPTIALDQPVTEVTILTLKAPENHETLVDMLSKVSETTGKMLVFGKTREDESKYIVIRGWPTVQEHWDAVAKPEAAAMFEKLYSLANKEHHYHTSLSQYRL